MEIRLGSLVRDAREAEGTVIIIDVFRAFTTAAIAFENGASEITLVAEVEEALALKSQGIGDVLMGEVGGARPEGFDYGNSPYEIAEVDFTGQAAKHVDVSIGVDAHSPRTVPVGVAEPVRPLQLTIGREPGDESVEAPGRDQGLPIDVQVLVERADDDHVSVGVDLDVVRGDRV